MEVDKHEISDFSKLRELTIGYAIGMGSIFIPVTIIISLISFIFGEKEGYIMFIVMILGLFTFFVFEEYIWFHILAMITLDLILGLLLIRKINSMTEPFQTKVIPQLWNEL